MEDKTIHSNKLPGKTYISKAFQNSVDVPDYQGGSRQEVYNTRVISKVIDADEQYTFVKIKDEIILRKTGKGRQEIRANILEDGRGINVLTLQRYTSPSGKPHETSFSFVGDEISILVDFIRNLNYLPINTLSNSSVNDDYLKSLILSKEDTKQFVIEHQELLSELLATELTKEDIVALGYRKRQLEIFARLLAEPEYFEELKGKYDIKSDEALWQRFFEKNTWIFGYGLSYVFNAPLENTKLEQFVAGSDFNSSGKRIDALLKTKGIIESFCFAEIKTHKSPLLKKVTTPYRPESWQISDEITGALAQVQRTVQKSLTKISTKTQIKDKSGNPTNETIFLYSPKAFIVIGSLAEFEKEYGINEDQYSSFEMFRRGLNKVEIITFDELYQRATFIIKNSEKETK